MMRFSQILLYPVALIYGLIVWVRNLLFDAGVLRSVSFPFPVISVGNLSAGGTGKTPHIEYLVRLLSPSKKVATLSRGYRRKTTGFVLADETSDARTVGDEPLQFFKKFPFIRVAVDQKRVRGIRLIKEKFPETDVVLLDDAFQHRYVDSGKSILLTDYRTLFYEDHMLPSGTLREFRRGAQRADIIIVTKTPKIFSPITRKRILEEMKPAGHQKVFFSYLKYGGIIPVFAPPPEMPQKVISILLFTGIANDYPLKEHLERECSDLSSLKFPDHHDYTDKDIQTILRRFNDLPTHKKIMVTTEKDCMRLKNSKFEDSFKNLPLFCIPVEIEFHGNDKAQFDQEILHYVSENRGNR